MTREELCNKICYSDYTNDCCSCDGKYDCNDCQAMIDPMLDDYEQTIRVKVIDEFANNLIKGFSWSFSKYSDEETIKAMINKLAEQLKSTKYMFKGIINGGGTVATNTNVPFTVVRNTNANTRYNVTTNEIIIEKSGYYNVMATLTAITTPDATITAQLYANGSPIDGASSTFSISGTESATFTIIDNIKVEPTLDASNVRLSIRFDGAVEVTDAIILVEKVR